MKREPLRVCRNCGMTAYKRKPCRVCEAMRERFIKAITTTEGTK